MTPTAVAAPDPDEPDRDVAPIVVPFQEMNRLFTGREALGNLEAAAFEDPKTTPVERAQIMASVGHGLTLLRQADAEAQARVLITAQHRIASRLQSLVASGALGTLTTSPLPAGGLEAKFDTADWFGWAQVAWVKLKATIKGTHPLPPAPAAPDAFPNAGRVALLGDWGTGLYGAPPIAQSIARDPDPYALLLHLGDVYYSGTAGEVRDRFLKLWPRRPEALHRAINSNHEMYSGGWPYFDRTLKEFGQQSSYFALQNQHWTLVGLDVAHRDHDIDEAQVAWLEGILAQAGERKVVFFSHHQLYSHFESQGEKLWGQDRFRAILESGRIHAWYWGHEHRCTLFEGRDQRFGIRARCIGNSGMPQGRGKTRDLPQAGEPAYTQAEWRRSPECDRAGNRLPPCVVLEGANPFIKGEEHKFSPHSFAVLTFDGPRLLEEIRDPKGAVLYRGELT